MHWKWSRRAGRGTVRLTGRSRVFLAAACAVALAGCNQTVSQSTGRGAGATVAFESIDGPPAGQFQTLVQNLNTEAQARQVAVISREQPSVYRVRGYLAAHVLKGGTTISWVWDVFDRDEHRALRIIGEETAKGSARDAWTAADNAMLARIARDSMDQLAGFLNSPEPLPGTSVPAAEPSGSLMSLNDDSPEAAGIFRIPDAKADPAPAPARSTPAPAVSARETLSLSAASH